MSRKFKTGQRVRIIAVDDIPYGLKYSYLESTMDKTGVVQENIEQSSKCVVLLDDDGRLMSISENALEEA